MVKAHEFDTEDRLEAAILNHLDSEGLVFARQEAPTRDGPSWSGDGRQLYVSGIVAGENGPEVFVASAWSGHGGAVQTRVPFRADLELATRRFLPGSGDVAAQEFTPHDKADQAVVDAAGSRVKYLARYADIASAFYLVRMQPEKDGEKELAILYSERQPSGGYQASLLWSAPFVAVKEWAEADFGPAVPQP